MAQKMVGGRIVFFIYQLSSHMCWQILITLNFWTELHKPSEVLQVPEESEKALEQKVEKHIVRFWSGMLSVQGDLKVVLKSYCC